MTKKVLYFTAGPVATTTELAEIAALNALTLPGYNVGVRNTLPSGSYGHGIEDCDLVAGTVPTAFNAKTNYGVPNTSRPNTLYILPATVAISGTGTQQLQVLKAVGTDISSQTLGDVTAVTTTYSSSVPGKATVSVGGLVTGVAAGTSIITATNTYASGKTITATRTVTVT